MRCFLGKHPTHPSRACVLINPFRLSRTNTPNKGRFHRLAARPTSDPARPRCGPRPLRIVPAPLSRGTQTQQLIPAELVVREGRPGGGGGGFFNFLAELRAPAELGQSSRPPSRRFVPARRAVPFRGEKKKRNPPFPRTITAPPPPPPHLLLSFPPPTRTLLTGSHR